MGVSRSFRSKQLTDATDPARVAIKGYAASISIDDPMAQGYVPTTTDGNALSEATTGSVTPQSFTGAQGARQIAPANPKRVALEVVGESGTVRLGYDNTVSSSSGRKLLATAVASFGRGPGVYQGAVWASDTGAAAVVQVLEEWNP